MMRLAKTSRAIGRALGSLAIATAITMVFVVQPAVAAEEHPKETHHSVHHLVGVKGSYLAGFSDGDVHHLGGGGLFLEVPVISGWLDLELGLRGLKGAHELVFPIDVLLKIPFHASHTVHPFVGAGFTVVRGFEEGVGTSFHTGGAFALGSYLWPWSWGGFVVEANYNLINSGDGLAHEVGPNLGFAYRF